MSNNSDILALLAYVKAKQGGSGSAEAVKAVDTEGLIQHAATIAPHGVKLMRCFNMGTEEEPDWLCQSNPEVTNPDYPAAYEDTVSAGKWSATCSWWDTATNKIVLSWVDPVTGDTVDATSYEVGGMGGDVSIPPMQVILPEPSEETTVQALLDEIARRVVEQIEAGAITGILGTAHGGTGNAVGYIQTGKKENTTPGTAATAEGISTTASGNHAHAEGYYSIASGINSHAEGNGAEATGPESHAEGYYTIASGSHSHAEGSGTKAASDCQHVFGRYNVWDTSDAYIEVVGNGTMPGSQSNARTLDWSGNEYIAGALSVGNAAQTRLNLGTAGSIFDITGGGTGLHNSIYRGQSLGTSVTAEQWARIADGSFDGMWIGDYWTINSTVYRIAAFDYWLGTGDTECTIHHVVIVPDTSFYNTAMNDTNTTSGGYVGSLMYASRLATAYNTISNAFGVSHILSHREYFVNTITNGKPSAGAWYNNEIELMNEYMVYGCPVFKVANDGTTVPTLYTIDKSQLPLFALNPNWITIRPSWWLRDPISATNFAISDYYGGATHYGAAGSLGVRPCFAICA